MLQHSIEVLLVLLPLLAFSLQLLLLFQLLCDAGLPQALSLGSLVCLDIDGCFQCCILPVATYHLRNE